MSDAIAQEAELRTRALVTAWLNNEPDIAIDLIETAPNLRMLATVLGGHLTSMIVGLALTDGRSPLDAWQETCMTLEQWPDG